MVDVSLSEELKRLRYEHSVAAKVRRVTHILVSLCMQRKAGLIGAAPAPSNEMPAPKVKAQKRTNAGDRDPALTLS